jgi:hypothetical protein
LEKNKMNEEIESELMSFDDSYAGESEGCDECECYEDIDAKVSEERDGGDILAQIRSRHYGAEVTNHRPTDEAMDILSEIRRRSAEVSEEDRSATRSYKLEEIRKALSED